MAAITGLYSTETFANERFKNYRRSVFYDYPNGAAPLTGLLSLMAEESTSDPEFKWWEKRLQVQSTTALANIAGGPFATVGNADQANPFNVAADDLIRIAVTDASIFRVGHELWMRSINITGGTTDLYGVVTQVFASTTPQRVEIRVLEAITGIANTSGNFKSILVVGSAFREGIRDISSSIYNKPVELANYCQIFRTPWTMTGTALKTGVKFDSTGAYKDLAKENALKHMIELERAFLFGKRSSSVDSTTSLPTRTTGGILWFLQQWEAANSVYRGGTGAAAITADSDDKKRIINNTSGTMSEKSFDDYVERAFRRSNNKANEKMVFCGSGFLKVINGLYKSKSVLQSDIPMQDTYGMNVVKHVSAFGTLFYKSHPLFTEDDSLRYSAMILDLPNLKYRYMDGRDTELLKNRQENDADYRKDEMLGEAGLELRFPESFMFIQNVRDIAV